MGVVDLARDQDGNRVALKRLTLHGSASEVLRARQRLLREATVLRRLHHPNVVRLLDVVEEGDDIVLVMPYLSGGNLAERVAQHGPAPPDEIDRLAQRMLGALVEAHTAGIIHRDVKPANVLYDDHAEPYLADFGLAHTWDQTHGLTVAGMVVGTPGFMPPEQARDEPLTPASDIFSLGASLLFAATGGGPFGSGDPGLLMVRAASGKVEKVPKTLPKTLRKRLQSMLDPKPERRPTAADLLSVYEPARSGRWPRPLPGSGSGSAPGAGGGGSSGPVLAVAAAGVAGVLAVAAFAVTRSSDDETGDAAPPLDEDSGDAPGEGGPETTPSAPGSSDGSSAGGQPDAETELVDRLDAMIEPPRGSDTYPLPIDATAGLCPRVIEVSLVLTLPEGSEPLRLVVLAGGTVVGESVARIGVPAVVGFDPGAACGEKDAVTVRVEPLAELTQDVPYALQRYDMY